MRRETTGGECGIAMALAFAAWGMLAATARGTAAEPGATPAPAAPAAVGEGPAGGVAAQPGRVRFLPARGASVRDAASASASDLTYNGGPVILSARVVFIFWGPSFANASSPDYLYAQQLQAFRNQFGTTPEYNVITQYYQDPGAQHIQLTNLGSGTPDWFDTSTPPGDVTDASTRGEVEAYLTGHAYDGSTIYEVVIPSSSYSSSNSDTSCGGPQLRYCAYHNLFVSGSNTVLYAMLPYASCGTCQVPGWTAAENTEHFVTHETREAVTDPQVDAWGNDTGEADDPCTWSPSPFLGTGGYGYQYEWSNLTSSCVQSIPITSHPAPSVTTSAASGVSATAATLDGTVDSNGSNTTAYFEWGTTVSYGNTTAVQNPGSGGTAVSFSQEISGLACATTYHFQAVAANSGGTSLGGDRSFTTGACGSARFFTVTPCRVYDNRTASPLLASDTYELGIAGLCGLDTGAKAVSANVTIVNATAGGSFSIWPAQTSYPGTSTVNFKAGQACANNTILLLAPGYYGSPGAVELRFNGTTGSVDLIVDVNGYFE